MRINKDNIYVIPAESKYFDKNKIDSYMENDFTLHVSCKVNYDSLETNKEAFIVARNGKHSGISVFRNGDGNLFIHFTYWFWKDGTESLAKSEKYILPKDLTGLYNTYTMICDHKKKIIKCYVNNQQIGTIEYDGLDKCVYTEAYFWFGCGSMFADGIEFMDIGDFDISFSFMAKYKFTIDEVDDITLNYKTEYTDSYVGNLRLLNDRIPHKNSFGFFIDFDIYSKYKIWNMVHNGLYPLIYMRDNTRY